MSQGVPLLHPLHWSPTTWLWFFQVTLTIDWEWDIYANELNSWEKMKYKTGNNFKTLEQSNIQTRAGVVKCYTNKIAILLKGNERWLYIVKLQHAEWTCSIREGEKEKAEWGGGRDSIMVLPETTFYPNWYFILTLIKNIGDQDIN